MDTLVILKDESLERWQNMRCNGHKRQGYWKGYPCAAHPTLRCSYGQLWCHNHAPLTEICELVKVINT